MVRVAILDEEIGGVARTTDCDADEENDSVIVRAVPPAVCAVHVARRRNISECHPTHWRQDRTSSKPEGKISRPCPSPVDLRNC